MKKVSLRGLIMTSILITLLLMFVTPANAQSLSPRFPATGHCAITAITLRGVQSPAVTCLAQSTSAHAVSPFTYRDYVCSSYNLVISDASGNGYCFNGTGYLAYRIANIWGFTSNNYNGWFRIYPNGSSSGWYQDWNSPGWVYGFYPYDGLHTITQICINRSSPTTC